MGQLGRILEFCYLTVSRSDSVVVIGAGLSTTLNKEKIIKYIDENKSTVFAANYNFESLGIKSHYTYITDPEKLEQNIMKINSNLIVPSKLAVHYSNATFSKFLEKHKRYNVYRMGIYNKKYTYGSTRILSHNGNGTYPFFSFGISGFGTILAASVCRPKKMLLVGIDAPKMNVEFKTMYDNKIVKYEKPAKCLKVINYFTNILLPTIYSMRISVETFSSVELLGLDKKKLRIRVLDQNDPFFF